MGPTWSFAYIELGWVTPPYWWLGSLRGGMGKAGRDSFRNDIIKEMTGKIDYGR